MKDGKPFSVSKFYTQSLHEKSNLGKDLVSWRGRAFTEEEMNGFDPKNLLGVPCLVTLIEKEKGGVKISSVTGLPKGMPVHELFTEKTYFSLEKFNQVTFDHISDGIKKIIQKSPEYQAVKASIDSDGPVLGASTEKTEDVPF